MKEQLTQKTNAVRLLDIKQVTYSLYSYEAPDGFLDGLAVAQQIGVDSNRVFKTLVLQGTSGLYYVCIIPVALELDLKKAATHFKEKKIEMIPAKMITQVTGYIKGGCSPLGMKKQFRTAIDQRAASFQQIVVSAGKVGLQMDVPVADLLSMANGQFAELV